jgi:hypothetical protein
MRDDGCDKMDQGDEGHSVDHAKAMTESVSAAFTSTQSWRSVAVNALSTWRSECIVDCIVAIEKRLSS